MNIFVLDTDPAVAAQLHCDKHVVKMILESAQMLCAALDAYSVPTRYKPTHRNHPCTIWTRTTRSNFLWLCDLGDALVEEHVLRYQPKARHKSAEVLDDCRTKAPHIPDGLLTDFAQAMPDAYRDADPVLAYRAYYRGDKQRFAAWREPRVRPEWMD